MVVICLVDLDGANGPELRREAAYDVLDGGLDMAFGLLCRGALSLTGVEGEMTQRARDCGCAA